MIKQIIKLVLLFTLLSTAPLHSMDYIKISKSTFTKMVNQIKFLQKVQKAEAQVSIKDLEIAIDKDNRVYIKDTVSVNIKVADLEYKGDLTTVGNIKVYQHSSERFISRFGLLYAAQTSDNATIASTDYSTDIYAFYDVFKLNRISLNLIGNFRRWGVGMGYGITPNTKIILGTNWRYSKSLKGNTKLFIGVGFNF